MNICLALPVPGKLPEPADNWRCSCKVLAVETLLDRYHSSEEAVVTPDMDPDEAIIEAAPPPPKNHLIIKDL